MVLADCHIIETITITITIRIRMITTPLVGYSLDYKIKLNIQDLEFKDTFSSLELNTTKYLNIPLQERIKLVEGVVESLDSSTNKGFLPSYDLSKFPIISDLLGSFIVDGNEEYIKGIKSMETYKWLYNFIILSLYLFTIESLQLDEELGDLELIGDLKTKERELFERLDPSIRHYLVKRGISLKENTYIGYDTEFTKNTSEENSLVSVQLAVCTKTYVQIPKLKMYQISILDEKTNRVIKQSKNSESFNYSKIELSIQRCIEGVRLLKYEQYDRGILILSESLKLIKGLSYFEQEDYTVFSTPRSLIQPFIQFCDSFSLHELLDVSSGLAKPFLEESSHKLMTLIKSIASNLSNQEGKDKMLELLHNKFSEYTEIEQIGVDNEKPLPFLSHYHKPSGIVEKRLTRNFLSLFSPKTSVTKTKCYYLIAHLTQADLSMLSDFKELKDELSIVNGSFVTIGNPINFRGKSIHIRDTMLLAPGGSKSLATIGKLYNAEFQKVQISKEDLEDMKGFLLRDKIKFTEYALRDALISLIHAS
jgi:hypothetical protein